MFKEAKQKIKLTLGLRVQYQIEYLRLTYLLWFRLSYCFDVTQEINFGKRDIIRND